MKELIITGVTAENYLSVVNKIEQLLPKVRWWEDNKKPHSVVYKALNNPVNMNKKPEYSALSIVLESNELAHFLYKTEKYKQNDKKEVVLTASQFLKQNFLNMPISRFI